GNLYAARESYHEATHTWDRLRSNLSQEEQRLSFARDKEKLFENLIDACLRLDTPDAIADAFDSLEKGKSRTLVDLMTRSVGVACGRTLLEDSSEQLPAESFLQLDEDFKPSHFHESVLRIQETLNPDTAFVEYFIVNGVLGAFVLRRGSMNVARSLGTVQEIQRR